MYNFGVKSVSPKIIHYTVFEFKAWIALSDSGHGNFEKAIAATHWSPDSILKTPFFLAVLARDRYFQLMRYLHRTDHRDEVKGRDSPGYHKLFKIRKL